MHNPVCVPPCCANVQGHEVESGEHAADAAAQGEEQPQADSAADEQQQEEDQPYDQDPVHSTRSSQGGSVAVASEAEPAAADSAFGRDVVDVTEEFEGERGERGRGGG